MTLTKGKSRTATNFQLLIEEVTREMQQLHDLIGHFEEKNRHSFFGYAQDSVAQIRKSGKTKTADNYEAALKHLKNYRQGDDLPFDAMTALLMKEFENHLRARGNCRNTTSFYMRGLRSIYNQAVEENLTTQKDIFKLVYTGVDKTTKRAISLTHIRRIKELDLTAHNRLEVARDLFLFSFYTRGMAFVDMAYLKKKDIKDGCLVYRRHKTGQLLTVKWEKEMQAIVNKYQNPTPYLLPIITRENGTELKQYQNALMLMNRKLKAIARLAGIAQSLSMYTSRHSWATIARDKNIPLSVISKGLGHDNDLNTQIYLASIRTEEVDRANRRIIRELNID